MLHRDRRGGSSVGKQLITNTFSRSTESQSQDIPGCSDEATMQPEKIVAVRVLLTVSRWIYILS
jgi:hypothetical protein